MKKLVIMLMLLVAVSFAASATISNDMLVETVIHHTPTGFVPLHSGDGAGYYFWDSGESSDFAPTYSWIDCTGGTDTGLNADDGYVNATLPAAWKLYGTDFASGNTITVSSNGGIGMGAGNYLSSNNRDIPLDDSFNGLLALYWDDLVWYASDGAYVYLYTDTSGDDDLYVISYDDGKHYGGTAGELSFQMYYVENNTGISSINNTVVFQYLDCSSEAGSSATVGIENDAGDAAAKYSFDSASLSDDLAIVFIDATYVDNYVGSFDLTAPADGSAAIDGTQVTFDWEDASYSGSGTLTYDLILSNNADLSSPFHTEAGLDPSTFDYTFSQGNTSDETVYWGVEANETTFGFSVDSDSIWSITLHQHDYAIEETTWGQIKSM